LRSYVSFIHIAIISMLGCTNLNKEMGAKKSTGIFNFPYFLKYVPRFEWY
jgi:hypothetical protein